MLNQEVTAHFDYLDGWRGLAILFLLIGHFFPIPGINLGTVGVNLFFVLSGLLMGRLLFIKQTPLPLFYKRRISRIFPVHFFFISIVTIVYLCLQKPIEWSELLSAAFFINNYVTVKASEATLPFGHIWSLSVEEHSYILLSLLTIATRKKWLSAPYAIGLFVIISASFGIWYWLHFSGQELDFVKWVRSEVSAFGILCSAFFLVCFSGKTLPRLPFIIYPILFIAALMLHWWSVPNPFRTIIGVGLFALLINILREAPEIIKKILSFKPLRQLGVWSFSIYIWQQPFYLMIYKEGLLPVTALTLAIVTGILSFYLIENPMRSYLNRHWAN